MGSVAMIRDQLRQAHAFLEGTLDGVSEEQARWRPPGEANPIGATYAHLVVGEDATIAFLSRREPLFATGWSQRTGLSELPPVAAVGAFPPLQPGWHDWGQRVQVDPSTVREYAQAVYAASDTYLTTLEDVALELPIEMTIGDIQLGIQPLGWVLSAALAGHTYAHWGEVSCLLGCQGAQGFPI